MTIVEEHCARLCGWTVRSGKLLGAKASAAAMAARITEDRTESIALLSPLLFFSLTFYEYKIAFHILGN